MLKNLTRLIFKSGCGYTYNKNKQDHLILPCVRQFKTSTVFRNLVPLSYSVCNFSNNHKLNVSQTTLVIIHGLFGSKKNFDSLAKIFSNKGGLQVVSLDARNHGDSGHDDDMSYNSMSNDVVSLLNNLGLKDVIVLGHSMGGKIAMTMALSNPDLIHALVVVDIYPGRSITADTDFFPRMINKMTQINFENNPGISIVEARKETNKQLSTVVQDRRIRDFLMTNLVLKGGKVVWRLNLKSINDYYKDLMMFPDFPGQTYDKPTVFIGGSLSGMLSEEYYPAVKKYFPSAEIIKIKGAGHWVHSDDPYNFSNKVLAFIKSLNLPTNEKT